MNFWENIKNELDAGYQLMIMYVLHSEGSSPGRQGFKMGVSSSQKLFGSIGGGIMEHKLVELCRQKLIGNDYKPFFLRQIHQDSINHDKSGMICSGEQSIAFYRMTSKDFGIVSNILNSNAQGIFGVLKANEQGITFNSGETLSKRFELILTHSEKWQIREDIGFFPILNIIGGGHVGLALSRIAYQLGFVVKVYDDREGLNTMAQNQDADCMLISDYKNIASHIPSGPRSFVVLMSFGYRTDKLILRKLLDQDYKYLGMMGSKKKVRQLFEELANEGVDREILRKVHSPIGIQIASKTPEEIAISILAELILVKNS